MTRWMIALAVLAGCAPGEIGAPCEVGGDCDDGLLCDRQEAGGSCQRPHAHKGDTSAPQPGGCARETRHDPYVIGLGKRGAWAHVVLVDAMPPLPVRGDNTWTLEVTDGDGQPLPDLVLAVDPFIPDHGHGTTVRCEVLPGAVPGQYVLEPVNLFQAGLWEVTVAIDDDVATDAVVFRVCVDP